MLHIAEEPEGEIGRQYIEGASGCHFSPYMISPRPPRPMTALVRKPMAEQVLIFLGIKITNFCQLVLNPLGSYMQFFYCNVTT